MRHPYLSLCLIDMRENLQAVLKVSLAGFRQRNATRCPIQESHAKAPLEIGNRTRGMRDCEVQAQCCGSEAP